MIKKNRFIINKDSVDLRLDKFLVKNLPEFSRSLIQQNIKEGLVLVNNKKTLPHYSLRENDIIEIEIKKIKNQIAENEIDLTPDKTIPLDVIFENEDFLIINKQSGLVVHPAKANPDKTLVNALLAYLPKIYKVGEDPIRPGIVHRLDKDVSGLLVVAKTQTSFDHLKRQFKNRLVKKEYLALVYGRPSREEGVITFDIIRSKRKPTLMAAVPSQTGLPARALSSRPTSPVSELAGGQASRWQAGRSAITHFEIVKKFVNYSLLKLTIKTGRTHQIRVHLKAFGYPIVGDQLYKIKKYKEKIKLPGVFLHAATLGFYDLKDNWQEFHSPLPGELENVLKNLK